MTYVISIHISFRTLETRSIYCRMFVLKGWHCHVRRAHDRVGGIGCAFALVRGSRRLASGGHAAAALGLCGCGLSGARAAAGRRVQLLAALDSDRLRASTARRLPDRCQYSCARCTSGALPERWLRIQQHHRVCILVLVPRTCTVHCTVHLYFTLYSTHSRKLYYCILYPYCISYAYVVLYEYIELIVGCNQLGIRHSVAADGLA